MQLLLFFVVYIFIKNKKIINIREAFICFLAAIMKISWQFTFSLRDENGVTEIIGPEFVESFMGPGFENFNLHDEKYYKYFFISFVFFSAVIAIIYIFFILKRLDTNNSLLFAIPCFVLVIFLCICSHKDFEFLRNFYFFRESLFCVCAGLIVYWNLKNLQITYNKSVIHKIYIVTNVIVGLYVIGDILRLPISFTRFIETVYKLIGA